MPRTCDTERYLQQGGARCPYCNGSDVQGDEINFDGGTMSQEISCGHCNARWIDIYRLVDLEPIDLPDDEDLKSADPRED